MLTADEAEQVIAQPNIHDPLGLRDRAILETLYSTGMRRLELVNLTIWDLDLDRLTVTIRQGKGKRTASSQSGTVLPLGYASTGGSAAAAGFRTRRQDRFRVAQWRAVLTRLPEPGGA